MMQESLEQRGLRNRIYKKVNLQSVGGLHHH
jgi:hypothetical protein